MSAADRMWTHDQRVGDAWAPVTDACKAVGVTADVAMLGCGCFCLHVPLSEDYTRWVWFGTDDDSSDPGNIDQFGPGNFLGGCAYWSTGGDCDDAKHTPLPDRAVNRDDPAEVARVIREMVVAATAIPREDYECPPN